MANNQNDQNAPCTGGQNMKKVEQVRLPDGRRSERHIIQDAQGNEVVEIFAEEQRPLKLEERIVREHKQIVAKETREIIKDGEVAHVEIRTLEPEVPLQIRSRIGVADHGKIVDGDYVRKEELGQMIQDGVVAGVEAMMENMEPDGPRRDYVVGDDEEEAEPYFSAQSIVEKNVEGEVKKDNTTNIVLAVIFITQLAFAGYMFFM